MHVDAIHASGEFPFFLIAKSSRGEKRRFSVKLSIIKAKRERVRKRLGMSLTITLKTKKRA